MKTFNIMHVKYVDQSLVFLLALAVFVSAGNQFALAKKKPKVVRAQRAPLWEPINKWDQKAENEFSDWIAHLGQARVDRVCLKMPSCLKKSESNTLWTEEDKNLKIFADCADVPYVLRAYFAYKTKRPFQWHRFVTGGQYTNRNKPKEFIDFTDPTIGSFNGLVKRVNACVHSGFYRMRPDLEDTDTFPVVVNRKTVRPGTVYYDPKGHVLIVYKVEDNGAVRLIDGHPDNTLTHKRFGQKFARGAARLGGGFRGWRWYSYDGKRPKTNRFVRETNAEIVARKGGLDGKTPYQKRFKVDGYTMNYYGWVRSSLSRNGARIDPVQEFDEMVGALCVDIHDREVAVNIAIEAGLHKKYHPGKLPKNIYGTTGEWEVYSTPSRDARLKATVRGLHQYIGQTVEWAQKKDARLLFDGTPSTLLETYRSLWAKHHDSEACQFSYTNSRGKQIKLTLNEVNNRLFALSFDPYACPEMRWGATPRTKKRRQHSEYASCPKSKQKEWWYFAEQRQRNSIERVYGVPTPISYGPEKSPNLRIEMLIKSLTANHAKAEEKSTPTKKSDSSKPKTVTQGPKDTATKEH